MRPTRSSCTILALLATLLGTPAFAASKNTNTVQVEEARTSRLSATWRSALVPGWGQWYRGQAWLGATYFGAFAVTCGGTQYYNSAGDDSYAKYQAAISSADANSLYDQAKQQDQMYATFSTAILGVYLVNLADAMLFTCKAPNSQAANPYVPHLSSAMLDNRNMGLLLRWQL